MDCQRHGRQQLGMVLVATPRVACPLHQRGIVPQLGARDRAPPQLPASTVLLAVAEFRGNIFLSPAFRKPLGALYEGDLLQGWEAVHTAQRHARRVPQMRRGTLGA